MNTALTILIVIISAILLAVLISYIAIMVAAHQLKKKTEDFMTKKGVDILNKGIDTGVSKFQTKLNQAIDKKNQKKM